MGLFELRCLITGVSTRFVSPVAFVPLLEADGGYRPAALPLWGTYDGYGSIDGVQSGPHSVRFHQTFVQLLQRNIIRVEWPKLYENPTVPGTPSEVCRILSLALIRNERAVTCDGRVLTFALLYGPLAEELLLEMPAEARSDAQVTDLARLAFGPCEPASSVFSELPPDDRSSFASALTGFIAFNQWLDRHGIAWVPPRDTGQFTATVALQFLATARERFANEPAVLRGLEQYEYETGVEDEE